MSPYTSPTHEEGSSKSTTTIIIIITSPISSTAIYCHGAIGRVDGHYYYGLPDYYFAPIEIITGCPHYATHYGPQRC